MRATNIKRAAMAVAVGAAGFLSLPQEANAVPTLQLGIKNGVYDTTTETVFATSSNFELYAFLTPDKDNAITDTYYISMALTPAVSSPSSLGSFSYNSNTVNVTADMIYGTPPVDLFSVSADPGDLAPHGVFPTYFKEVGFSFNSANQSSVFNTQDHPTWGPQAGTGMYYQLFNINTSNLAQNYAIHFDLYNTKLCTAVDRKGCAGSTDTDITQFAPFSHDAQSMVSSVPEPETYAMLLAGLGLMGAIARRRKAH